MANEKGDLTLTKSTPSGVRESGFSLKESSPGEFHPQALAEPDVNLSAHPAPIIQRQVKSPFANAQIALAPVWPFVLANCTSVVYALSVS